MSTVKALLFDMGGVVLTVNFDRVFQAWAEFSTLDAQTIKSRFKMDYHYQQHEIGKINSAEYFDHVRKTLLLSATDSEIAEGWNAIFGTEISECLDAIDSIRNTIPVYGYTNTNRAHQIYWEQQFPRIHNTFEKVFISNEIGLRKPDAEAFEYVLEQIGIQAEALLFFDDTAENIEGAKQLGIQTALVTDPDSVLSVLEVLPSA